MQDTDAPTITTDIAIVGSGMGGGTLAYALRNRGAKILIIERGGYLPREPENWSPREIFVAKRYRTTDPYFDGSGKPFRPSIYHVVGGCTKVYGAALPRFRREDFGVLESEEGVSPAWPVGYDELEPYYAEAERLFRVHGTAGTDPVEGPRSTPFPFPAVPHEPAPITATRVMPATRAPRLNLFRRRFLVHFLIDSRSVCKLALVCKIH